MYKVHKLALTVIVVVAIMQICGARNDNILGLAFVAATILTLLVALAICFKCGRWFAPGIATGAALLGAPPPSQYAFNPI